MSVIGGADGPTAIYITTSGNWALAVGAVVAAAGVVIVLLVLRSKKKNKR